MTMTKDQIRLLKALGIFVGFKAILYTSIRYSAAYLRQQNQ